MTRGSVDRFRAGVLAATAAVGAGLALGSPALVVAAVPGLVYAAYARVTAVPDLDLAVERTVSTTAPLPGDEVSIELVVRNEGERTIPDLRIEDGVPDGLDIVDGDAAAATSLSPDDVVTVEYSVSLRRGLFEFDPVVLEARNASGSEYSRLEFDESTTIRCAPRFDQVPLHDETTEFPGTAATDEAGQGIEFYATREYQRGDPMSRIDWNRLARTGELTTVQFRSERAATVVVLVDARQTAAVAPGPNAADGVELAGYLAERAVDALTDAGHRVAVATVSDGSIGWIAPGVNRAHRARCRRTIQAATATGPDESAGNQSTTRGATPVGGTPFAAADGGQGGGTGGDGRSYGRQDGGAGSGGRNRGVTSQGTDTDVKAPTADAQLPTDGQPIESLRPRLPPEAQLLVATPLVDRPPVDWVDGLAAVGRQVTVLSPDPTETDRPGAVVAGVERSLRIDDLYDIGTPVVDWSPGDPVTVALAEALRRWFE